MTVTEEQLKSFIALFKQEFGIELSPADARYRAESLLYFIACSFEKMVEKHVPPAILMESETWENEYES